MADPVAPPKPITEPAPAPTEPQRFPRRTVPLPPIEDPSRVVPLLPIYDPKDLNPKGYYIGETGHLAGFWKAMPKGLRQILKRGYNLERDALREQLEKRFGTLDKNQLAKAAIELEGEIEAIENEHSDALHQIINDMLVRRHGSLVNVMDVAISKELPKRKSPFGKTNATVPQLPDSWLPGLYYRTELRNLWQQGEGWLSMQEFAFGASGLLNEIKPGLATKYQDLDRLYRYLQMVLFPPHELQLMIEQENFQLTVSGREVVTIHFEIVEEDGKQVIRVKENGLSAIARGHNAWSTIHEARKAGVQLATPNEAALRWLLSPAQRKALNRTTNSPWAEIRQGVLGPSFVLELRKRLAQMYKGTPGVPLTDAEYYYMVDGLFAMPPQQFTRAMELLFDDKLLSRCGAFSQAVAFLSSAGVFP